MNRIVPVVLTSCLVVFCCMCNADEENGLTFLMKKHDIFQSTAQVTPTICELCDVEKPKDCIAVPLDTVLQSARQATKMEKVLIFCPDATGKFLVDKYPEDWKQLIDVSTNVVTMVNVLPSVTPVCFGAIFTGCPPEIHGIRQYNDKYKPNPIKVETLFDAFTQSGKKVAVVASKNCSIDLIFRGHKADFYTVKNSDEAVCVTKKLIHEDKYDLIVCYDGDYDSTMHSKGVFAPESLFAMRKSISRYLELVEDINHAWENRNYVSVFCPDHGAHDNNDGKGTHGSDKADDTIVNHFYRFYYTEK